MTTTREAALEAALNDCIAAIEHADMADGVCCCGDNMDNHSEPMNCGHSPVDAGEYHAHQALTAARAALSTPATEPHGYVDELIEKLRAGVVQCGLHEDNNTELFDIEDANEAMFEAAQALAARPTPQPAAEHDPECSLVERGQSCTCHVSQPAAEHEYPDPLIAEDRYEDDQPAADTRMVPVWQLERWCAYAEDGLVSTPIKEIRAIIGTATPAPSDKIAEAARVVRPEAIDALAAYQQADMDGVMVLVSRQAIEECLPALRALAGKGE